MQYIFGFKIVLALLLAFVGYFIVGRFIRRFVLMLERKAPSQLVGILRYMILYGFYFLLLLIILQTAGVNLSAVIAAAGIAGIAIGFAAQTSLSNIISGIMLLIEQSFKIGDLIRCEELEGIVETVGLLSIQLRTPDNRLIRIPNERFMKDTVINLTAHDQRMLSFIVTVNNTEDLGKVRDLLEKITNELPQRVPDKPATIFFFGSSFQPVTNMPTIMQTVHFKVLLWVPVTNILAARSAFMKACLQAAQEQKPPLLLTITQD